MPSCQWSPAPTKLKIERGGGHQQKNMVWNFVKMPQKKREYSRFFPEKIAKF
jgi:hypothetical protein